MPLYVRTLGVTIRPPTSEAVQGAEEDPLIRLSLSSRLLRVRLMIFSITPPSLAAKTRSCTERIDFTAPNRTSTCRLASHFETLVKHNYSQT